MKRLLLSALFVASFGVLATAEDKPLNTPPEGFTALFNGKDLTGWKGLVGNPKSRAAMNKEQLAKDQEAADKKAHGRRSLFSGRLLRGIQ